MAHIRTSIRQAVISALQNYSNLTTIVPSSSIDAYRKNPVDIVPQINVTQGTDRLVETTQGMSSRSEYRLSSLTIEVRHAVSSDLDVLLDDIELQVLGALFVDETLGGLSETITFNSSTPVYDGDQRLAAGLLSIEVDIGYYVKQMNYEV